MRRIVIITTKNIPIRLFDKDLSEKIGDQELSKYVEEHLMIRQAFMPPCIDDYLAGYYQMNLSSRVTDFLDEVSYLPIFKIVLGENQRYILYVTLCISANLLQGSLDAKHGYIAKLVELAKKDAEYQDDDQIYVIAHDKDLGERGNNFYNVARCKGALAAERLASGHVFYYEHRIGHQVYDDFINRLSANNEALLSYCDSLFTCLFD